METRDHFKNGASSKSQMSRVNFRGTNIDGVNRLERWKIIIPIFSLILIFMSCSQPDNTVRGYIEGLSNDTVLVFMLSLDNYGEQQPVQDTILCENGRLNYSFPDDGAYILMFSFQQFHVLNRPEGGPYAPYISFLTVFTEPGDRIHFKGNFNSVGFSSVTISGSKLNQDFSPLQSKTFEIRKNEVDEEMALEQACVDNDKEKEKIGWAKRRERENAVDELFENYLRTNLDNPLSAFLLINLSFESLDIYYHKLGENARNSIFRTMLDGTMEQYYKYTNVQKAKKEVVAGSKAPEFTLDDMDGKPFTLSSLLGKYVIIDFWGSWCGPCVSGIPKMKIVYEKYKDKLEILGVACNEQSVNIWREAVKKYELPWLNVYNDKSSAVNVTYGIMGYPTKIVIDPEGTILIREQGEEESFYTKLESIIK